MSHKGDIFLWLRTWIEYEPPGEIGGGVGGVSVAGVEGAIYPAKTSVAALASWSSFTQLSSFCSTVKI